MIHDSISSIRIAMWSGPRNISTALMRSWGNRADTFVCDEPLYAHFLRETGIDHPGREEVLVSQENDCERVVAWLTGETPENKNIFYQKHMAHHLLPGMSREWVRSLANAFLIRNPREMLTSLLRVTPRPTIDDTGLPQQWELYEELVRETRQTPPVIDAKDVLDNPRALLTKLCGVLGVGFDDAMLSWPSGRRPTDGVWAKYWYAAVEKSTGFRSHTSKPDVVPEHLSDVHDQCCVFYDKLYAKRLSV